ncbi:uncharacterized protein (DUF2235 family) [Rhizobium leguminosarum]|uniref:Uncharacterized protein (DUF2235 family) n=1 Tax=Rhizobium leguminosarum TaxID=384 RepID=A0A7Z0E1U5_RHILE|nr:DUF2235 domain-containing protein [Rhizobium leguminosarum]NYJ13049.1 uncharacterized protein (DUF2235 family) [Rhizobium leguminosarum]
MKNVVICCDGTANQFAADKTNVIKLFSTLVQDAQQVAFYHPGVGTMEPDGAITDLGRKVRRVLGMAVGWGLEKDLAHAYNYIMNVYEPGDRLFLFGFSRGAYTVRALASVLSMYGLFPKGNEPLVPYAIRQLIGFNDDNGKADEKFKLAADFKTTFSSVACPIHFMGVWDTVSSVGWIANPLRVPHSAYNPDVLHARHAIAIDERRAFFRTNRFTAPPPGYPTPDTVEVWFPGVHCDVGGGYAADESGLSKLALEWMLAEAVALGLCCDRTKAKALLSEDEEISENGTMHWSLRGWWWLAEIVPKRKWRGGWRVNLADRRTVPEEALIHRSALARHHYSVELPKNYTVIDRPRDF